MQGPSCGLDDGRIIVWLLAKKEVFINSKHPERVWDQLNLVLKVYQGFCSRE